MTIRLSDTGTLTSTAQFSFERIVGFGDCDPAGIVYFPNYYLMLHETIEAWWRHLGIPLPNLINERRVGTPTAHLETDFVAPSRFGETLTFRLAVEKLGTTSLILRHVADSEGIDRVRMRHRMVATSLHTHRPLAWPEDVHNAISNFMRST